jgi:hypothetical protein
MKKVLVAGAALMLVGSFITSVQAADDKKGVEITGNARVRLYYKDGFDFGNNLSTVQSNPTNMDSRVRIQIKGTSAGGSYVVGRVRLADGLMSGNDTDTGKTAVPDSDNNVWADMAYVGVPFTDTFTLEMGKYRSSYDATEFFYYDLVVAGMRGIIKAGSAEINPFLDWTKEAALKGKGTDFVDDNDEMRFGLHAKNKFGDWTVGGLLGYQVDNRGENVTLTVEEVATQYKAQKNEGVFAAVYTKGKSGQFGFEGELAYNDKSLNGFNQKNEDDNYDAKDSIGDKTGDDGMGGFVQPTFTMDKLTLGLNAGFTLDGFTAKNDFGFVFIGDDTPLTAVKVGNYGDWMWGGFIANYKVNDALQLTGYLAYATIDSWTDGAKGANSLSDAWELSGILQYTVCKGADFYLSGGMLAPSFDDSTFSDDAAMGAMAKFELTF